MSTPTATPSPPRQWAVAPARLGVWSFLATVTMLFAAFSSALLIRRAAPDWAPIELPTVLWLNTALLVGASLTLERAKARGGERALFWLLATSVLSVLFLLGQWAGWRLLVQQGVYVPTNPHGAFFYILSGLHGLHLVGGLGFLAAVTLRAAGKIRRPRATPLDESIALCATYWHFLGGLWIYLFAVLAMG